MPEDRFDSLAFVVLFPHRFIMGKAGKKKTGGETLNTKLALVIKSGKYTLGYKSTLKTLRAGKAKLVILANNTPPIRKSEVSCRELLCSPKFLRVRTRSCFLHAYFLAHALVEADETSVHDPGIVPRQDGAVAWHGMRVCSFVRSPHWQAVRALACAKKPLACCSSRGHVT